VLAGTSDGGAHTKNFSGGQWTTDLLLWLTQEHALFSLEEMHYRLSAQPAAVIGLKDRGTLVEGMAADLVVYSPSELYIDQSHYLKLSDQPGGDWRRKAKAGGYRWILVNGRITFDGDKPTGTTPGTYLRVTQDAHRLAA
jgi:N-acyl-D-aspartate/D-glutamate deacylase